MTHARRTFLAGTGATFASIGFLRARAKAAQFTYKYGSNVDVSHPLNVRMVQLWNAVKAETNGRLDVQMFPNNQLGGDTAMLTQLRSGALQFFTLDGGILQSVVPVAAIQGVGFAFKNGQDAFRAFDGSLGDYVRKEIKDKGIWVFDKMWDNGMRDMTSSKGPIRSAADLANFKIRTPPGKLWVDLFKALGASPSPLNFSEVYTALQTKIFDGQENPPAIIQVARLFEVQKYLSITNHMWSAFHLLANMDAWKALPPDVQSVVTRNAAKYALLQRRDTQLLNDTLLDKLRREGMTVNTADVSGFRPRLTNFYHDYRQAFGDAAWGLLEQTSGKLG
ncbi:MAG: TRAP transporter substrate-binding protein [Candidatus Eremiobacteraeota bacterium]|nr:TRAP transporter substrate-binding protein [Candidatus Eremiobacteraeota bacterium]